MVATTAVCYAPIWDVALRPNHGRELSRRRDAGPVKRPVPGCLCWWRAGRALAVCFGLVLVLGGCQSLVQGVADLAFGLAVFVTAVSLSTLSLLGLIATTAWHFVGSRRSRIPVVVAIVVAVAAGATVVVGYATLSDPLPPYLLYFTILPVAWLALSVGSYLLSPDAEGQRLPVATRRVIGVGGTALVVAWCVVVAVMGGSLEKLHHFLNPDRDSDQSAARLDPGDRVLLRRLSRVTASRDDASLRSPLHYP